MLDGTVLITGGAGFIARALYRRAEREAWPAKFVAFSRDDAKHAALARRYPNVQCVRGDVTRDPELLAAAMAGADLVIHAAAAKYVDLSEHAAWDTVTVNVDGSRNVALAARAAGVARVVGISTDKACRPVNVYGMSKAMMERLFTEADRWDTEGPEFVCVRYGNVIGSTGSVIPIMRANARANGVVRLTDPDMTRFWMSPDDAVDLIVLAATRAARGSVVVREPSAARMDEVVAGAVAPFGGRLEISGLRPGEKMHETLVHEQESPRAVMRGERLSTWLEIRPPGEMGDGEAFSFDSDHPTTWLTSTEIGLIADDAESI